MHAAQRLYTAVLSAALDVVYVSDVYDDGCMQRRNEWMIDHATRGLGCWDGSRGGTNNARLYALHKKVPLEIIDPKPFLEMSR